MKSFTHSKTLWGLVVILFSETIQVSTWHNIEQCFSIFGYEDGARFAATAAQALTYAAAAFAWYGRMKAGGLYTPPFLPGPNKPKDS